MIGRPAVRRGLVPIAVAGPLLLVYGLTLARDVTFWDAGEFIAAAMDFGIPHPPGTPLYVLLLRVAVLALGAVGVSAAVATSLVSATATASACAAGAALLARATGDRVAAVGGGLAAGTMASVWLNATETEVYSVALALSVAIVWAAERAGRTESAAWTVLTVYLIVLAVPLHLSALLVAPAAVVLALRWSAFAASRSITRAVVVGAGVLAAFALGRMTTGPALAAAGAMGVAAWRLARSNDTVQQTAPGTPRVRDGVHAWRAMLPVIVTVIAASALLVLLFRARHDPAINQGNPATWSALLDVVARRQYAVADLWPRLAPLWLQVGNLLLYADWQVAQSLGPTIFATPARTAATVAFVVFGLIGAQAHRRRDPRTWAAFALLLAAGTVGAALYLNLKAGPSFGHGVLPEGTVREARERDYFFVLGWWTWGIWAGAGAVAAARRLRVPGWVGIGGAALPLVLNWSAVDRTRLPEAALPRGAAEGLLTMLPPRAVLFVAGDNDTYPLWYAQRAGRLRQDVTVITTPLLPADWYRDELARRHGLFSARGDGSSWRGRAAAIREIASRAAGLGRPLAMAVSMPATDRAVAGPAWTLRGPVYIRDEGAAPGLAALTLDTTTARRWQSRLAELTHGREAHPSMDGTSRYMLALLRCPGIALAHRRVGHSEARSDSLAQYCNFR